MAYQTLAAPCHRSSFSITHASPFSAAGGREKNMFARSKSHRREQPEFISIFIARLACRTLAIFRGKYIFTLVAIKIVEPRFLKLFSLPLLATVGVRKLILVEKFGNYTSQYKNSLSNDWSDLLIVTFHRSLLNPHWGIKKWKFIQRIINILNSYQFFYLRSIFFQKESSVKSRKVSNFYLCKVTICFKLYRKITSEARP